MTITSTYTVLNTDNNTTLAFGGSLFFTITLGAVSGYVSVFNTRLVNTDNDRAKRIKVVGGKDVWMWPGQYVDVFILEGSWYVSKTRWKHPGGHLQMFTDAASGSDVEGDTDGLSPSQPFASVHVILGLINDQFDFRGWADGANTRVVINMRAACNDPVQVHCPVHAMLGAQGGAAVSIKGASLPLLGCQDHGDGRVRITVSDTSTYQNNVSIVVYDAGSGADGTWPVGLWGTNSIVLLGSSFTGNWAGGGVVTNGSGIAPAADDAIQTYFGTVLQIGDLALYDARSGALGRINVERGSIVDIQPGVQMATPVVGFGQVVYG